MPENKIEVRDYRGGGFQILGNEVPDEFAAKIGPLGLAVYVILCRYVNYDTSTCFPSQELIAEKLNISRNTVKRGLVLLEATGMITSRRDGDSVAAKTIYSLLPTRAQNLSTPCSKSEHERAQNLSTNNTKLTRLNKPLPAADNLVLIPLADTRSTHTQCREIMFRCYVYLNEGRPCPWDESDSKQLSVLLKSNQQMTVEKFREWLLNYADSGNINPADRPRKIISRLTSYASGPLNEYGRPLVEKKRSIL